jgi:hypothetical protein
VSTTANKGAAMKYTDLELNKMIAELEGAVECQINTKGYLTAVFDSLTVFGYNAVENWSTLGPLMVKYKVEPDYCDCDCSIWSENQIDANSTVKFESESEVPRAIIICILKSKNII